MNCPYCGHEAKEGEKCPKCLAKVPKKTNPKVKGGKK